MVQRTKDGYALNAWFTGKQHRAKHRGQLNRLVYTADLLQHDGAWYTAKAMPDGQRVRHRLVIPDAPGLRTFDLSELHDTPHVGHFWVTKTQRALERSSWWPSCRADVRTFVCNLCKLRAYAPKEHQIP